MFQKRLICLLAVAVCLAGLAVPGVAAEVDSDSIYCFSDGDFSQEALTGICITSLPDPASGTVMLGTRVVQPGDIFTAEQLAMLTFCPVRTEQDSVATVGYLPIYADRVDRSTTMTISIRGKENKAPVAKDQTLETYKNIPNEGVLKVTDPEGQMLTYTVVRQPRRGTVVVNADGTFVYTPKQNKVGVDSFTFTAADPEGKVSREATVTVQILKPSQSTHYRDTVGLDCRFEAEWLRSTGLFAAEQVGGESCFQPEKAVSRGQLLAMLLESVDAPMEGLEDAPLVHSAPTWLKPYLSAAIRSGLVDTAQQTFEADAPVTAGEAALWLQQLTGAEAVHSDAPMTRADAACFLYDAARREE